jgi:hypothetical protein
VAVGLELNCRLECIGMGEVKQCVVDKGSDCIRVGVAFLKNAATATVTRRWASGCIDLLDNCSACRIISWSSVVSLRVVCSGRRCGTFCT